MIEICPVEQCTGCGACFNVCGQSAIMMIPDVLGFLYPKVNANKCVDCGLCVRCCPNNKPVEKYFPKASYVGHAVNSVEQLTSTSGGIATVIGRWCISQGGVMYGCSANDCMHVQHVRVDNERDLEALKGSKYVQSNIGNCYTQIYKDLQKNSLVVFVGTPCQVAGLKSYLRKDYTNLYTIDFVCHGVPSQQILNEELKLHASEEVLKMSQLSFRKKIAKGSCYRTKYGIFLKDASGADICSETFPNNIYITGFLQGLYYRESCYQCNYSTPERVSDITLGDYGDHDEKYKNMEGRKRLLSMIVVNTGKGKQLKDKIARDIVSLPITYSEVVAAQGQLQTPMRRSKNRDFFEQFFREKGFKTLTNSLLVDDVKKIRKNLQIAVLKELLFRIPFIQSIYKMLKNR